MTQQFAPPQGYPQAYAPPQQQGFPQQPAPQQPAPQQAPQAFGQPGGYPQQYQQPYPQQGGFGGQQFGAPQGYPQPGYGAPAPEQAPTPPPVASTLSDFWEQPQAGQGPSLSWKNQPEGTWYQGRVSRDVVDSDVRQGTKYGTQDVPDFFRDGRPKRIMNIPVQLVGSSRPDLGQAYPEGTGIWIINHQDAAELVRAMQAAGCGGQGATPKEGDEFIVTWASSRPTQQGQPIKVKQIQYRRPAEVAARVSAEEGTGGPQQTATTPAAPQPEPVAQPGFSQSQVPAQAGPPSAPQGFPAQPQQQQVAQQQQQVAAAPQPGFGQAPPQQAPGFGQPQQQGAPAAQNPAAPAAPAMPDLGSLTPEQQAVFQNLIAQQG